MTAYEEIMNALRFYLGDDTTDVNINEIISQEHDPIQLIANALENYRECEVKEPPILEWLGTGKPIRPADVINMKVKP